jgi:prepilin-type N-terminal cleavage/methylation domain-containing protein
MRKIFQNLKKLKANSFTLVELLVVISIIGLLAGLAVPAIQGGLDKAKQQVDVSNIRQCGIVAFSYANDNEGNYNGTNTNAITSTAFFTNLVSLGVLNSTKILAGNGYTAALTTNNILVNNIAWGYNSGLTASDDGNLPLFISKNVGPSLQTFSNIPISAATVGWKSKGIVVFRIGNNAEFIKPGTAGSTPGNVTISGVASNLSTATWSDQ